MGGVFLNGETKVRPGSYFRTTTADVKSVQNIKGTVAVLFRADFGPLSSPVELYKSKDTSVEIADLFGAGQTVDALIEAFAGGAQKLVACRVGNGGTKASVILQDVDGSPAVTVTAKYPGKVGFAVSVRDALENIEIREVLIYKGVQIFEQYEFEKGGNESAALAEAMAESEFFVVAVTNDGKQFIDVTQEAFSAGTNPTATTEDYVECMGKLELYDFDVACVDTEDTAMHLLLAAYIDRISDAGQLCTGIVAEKHGEPLKNRMDKAASYNNEKMHYILNSYVKEGMKELEGYQTAARIAGMIASTECNISLTHTALEGVTELMERLTNTQMAVAELSGCIVLSYSNTKKVWIDNAINTLVKPSDKQDDGWKKIRRTKTRFELIRRVNAIIEDIIGKVDNDVNGRATLIARIQDVGTAMVEESKLYSCKVNENMEYVSDGDSAWFDIDVVDKDSMEHVYMTYKFQFSTNLE